MEIDECQRSRSEQWIRPNTGIQQLGLPSTERLGEPPTLGTSTNYENWAQQFHFQPVATSKRSVAKKLGCNGNRSSKLGMKPAVETSFLGVLIHQRMLAFPQWVSTLWVLAGLEPWKCVSDFGLDSGFTTHAVG